MRGSLRIGKRVYPTVSQHAGTKNRHADMLQDLQPPRKKKKHLTTNRPNTGPTGTDIEDGEGPHVSGEFDQDEPEETLGKVRASKSSAHPSRDRASAGSGSGYQTTIPAINQSGSGPVVARKTEQVRIELLYTTRITN